MSFSDVFLLLRNFGNEHLPPSPSPLTAGTEFTAEGVGADLRVSPEELVNGLLAVVKRAIRSYMSSSSFECESFFHSSGHV